MVRTNLCDSIIIEGGRVDYDISTFTANKNKTTQSYLFNLKYAGGFAADFTIKPDWFRMFEVPNKITLENLSQVILSILNWDDGHLHVFRVVNRNYAYIGINSLIVPDLFENCFSSAIRIGDLYLKKTDQFYYTFDFGLIISLCCLLQIFTAVTALYYVRQ